MPQFAVILPAAGQSTRFGGAEKKPYLNLCGRPVWCLAAENFAGRPDVCQLIVVVAPEDVDPFRARYAEEIALLRAGVVAGGAERFESVANALRQVRPEADFVAVHDAARPCVT